MSVAVNQTGVQWACAASRDSSAEVTCHPVWTPAAAGASSSPRGKLDLGQPWDLFDPSERQLSSKTVVISCTRLTRSWEFSDLGNFFVRFMSPT